MDKVTYLNIFEAKMIQMTKTALQPCLNRLENVLCNSVSWLAMCNG